jgi:hypothetical protein
LVYLTISEEIQIADLLNQIPKLLEGLRVHGPILLEARPSIR